jgi:putative ABC transport system permease protein
MSDDYGTFPKWPVKLLRLFVKKEYLEELEGDLEEVYREYERQYSGAKLKTMLLWELAKLVRPVLLRRVNVNNLTSSPHILNSNLKISFRVFSRNKAYTLINVFGLGLGLAIALMTLQYVRFELSYESQIPSADRLVRVTVDLLNAGTVVDQDAQTYHPVGPRIQAEFPEVQSFSRAYSVKESTVRIGDEFLRGTGLLIVDSSFFSMFGYPMLYGNPAVVFRGPDEAVLTRSQAMNFFGKENAVGESFWISTVDRYLKVTGIVADPPVNSHLKFDVLIPYATIKTRVDEAGWRDNNTYTYIKLKAGVEFSVFANSLEALSKRLNAENRLTNEKLVGQKIADIHLHSHKGYEMDQNGDASSVYFLFGVALLVIIVAMLNYINLATSKSLDRAKEVGIRKVTGSTAAQLRIQFFTESMLVNGFAGILAVLLMTLAQPTFKSMSGLPSSFYFYNDPLFWWTIAITVVAGGLLAGAFPAIILSSFQPIQVLKGKFSRSNSGVILRQWLVVVQFVITIFLLIQTFAADQQLRFMRQKDLGLNIEQTVVVRAHNNKEGSNKFLLFKNTLLKQSQFESVSLSNCVPGQLTRQMGSTNSNVTLVGTDEKQSFNFYLYFVDANFIPTMKMKLLAGENFIAEVKNENQVIVNEESLRLWKITDPNLAIGKKINLWGKQPTIIGVIKNFHQSTAKDAFIPMIFRHVEDNNFLASIRTVSKDMKSTIAQIKSVYTSIFPGTPFDYFFLDEEFDKQYRRDEQFEGVFGVLTTFAVVIACLGLFGLVSFTVAAKTKEIGVRKILGAGVYQIMNWLAFDFMKLICISTAISVSITYFAVKSWLDTFAFRIDIAYWLFLLPALSVILLSFLTIIGRIFQVALVNPVNALRNE